MSIETAFERHYAVEQLAETWHVSTDFVRRLFLREPGVVIFHHQRPGRRVYRTLRIHANAGTRAEDEKQP